MIVASAPAPNGQPFQNLQEQIDTNTAAVDSFFDIFIEIQNLFGVDSFFDVFTELQNQDAKFDTEIVALNLRGDGLQFQVDSFLDVLTQVQNLFNVDSFFDVFTELNLTDASLQAQITSEASARIIGDRRSVVIGVVEDTDNPEGLFRVRVRFPWILDSGEEEFVSNWARLSSTFGSSDKGSFFLPEVDDEVVVAFEHGDIDRPIVIGALWNQADKSPLCSISCSGLLDPVCGTDGKTYLNPCEAGCAQINISHTGRCDDQCIPKDEICKDPCTPDCTNKQCGDDGCGGTCGTCESGQSCSNESKCVNDQPSCNDLMGIDFGSCEAILGWGFLNGQCTLISGCNSPAPLFATEALCTQSCAQCCDPLKEPGLFGNPFCFEGTACCPSTGDWLCSIGDGVTYACPGFEKGPFTSACELPKCGGIAGTQCTSGLSCIDDPDDNCDPVNGGADCPGICVEEPSCIPDCEGKLCGGDGCGGSCGTCNTGESCGFNGQCVQDTCIPDCANKLCGSDGCGNTCGTCNTGESCDIFGQCRQP